MVAVRELIWGPSSGPKIPASIVTVTLNDADNAVGFLFSAPKSGNIDRGALYISAETGASPAYKIGIYTIDASANPTQTPVTANSFLEVAHASIGIKEVIFTAAAVVAKGELYCLHIFPGATAPDASNSIAVGVGYITAFGEEGLPAAKRFTTAWALAGGDVGTMPFGIRYDDGSWYYGAYGDSSNVTLFDSADTPDEYGAKFTVPLGMTIAGVRIGGMNPPSAGDSWTITLYDASSNVLESKAVDADITTQSDSVFDIYFATDVVLTADAVYRLAVTNSSAVNTMWVNYVDFGTANQRSHWPDGSRWAKTTRTDSGAWTDDETMVPWWGLIVSDIGQGGAGGGALGNVSRPGALGYSRAA